jgi:hypothetical protein
MKAILNLIVMAGLAILAGYTHASHIVVSGPPAQLHLGVGTLGATVDTVSFVVASGSEGNSVAVAGSATVLIEVAVRRAVAQGTTVRLQVDSSTDLNTAPAGPSPIPMTEISWTAALGVIPTGSYDGSNNQLLLEFTAPQGLTRREDTHTFSYANTMIPVGGSYSGTVTYTAIAL